MAIKTLMIGLVVALTLGTTDARCFNETTGDCVDCAADCADYDINFCKSASAYTFYMNVWCQKTCDSCPGGPVGQPFEGEPENKESGSWGQKSSSKGSNKSGGKKSGNKSSSKGNKKGKAKHGKMSWNGSTLFKTNSESQSQTSTLVSVGAGCVLLAGVAGVAYKYKNRLGYSAVEQTEDSKVPNIIV